MPIPIVIQRPHDISFSKNQLLWKFYCPTAAGSLLDFKLTLTDFEVPDALTNKTYQTQVKPDAEGIVSITAEDIVDSMIDCQYPVITGIGNMAAPSNVLKQCFIEFRQITDATPSPTWENSEVTNIRYVIKGGIELLKHDYNNYFVNMHGISKPFATWQPKYRMIGITDSFYMSILCAGTFNTTTRNLTVQADWVDGTSTTLGFPITPEHTLFGMFNFKAGITDLGIPAAEPTKTLWRYKIRIEDATTSTMLSEEYILYADYREFYNTKIFNYYNSLGGIDHVRILGDTEESYNRNFTEFEKFTGAISIRNAIDTEYSQTNQTRLNTFKSDIGLRHTPEEVLAIEEIFTSPLVWEVVNGKNIRVHITNKNNKLIQKTDKRWAMPIEWRYGFTEQVYTPVAANLGTGTNLQVYGPYALERTFLPDYPSSPAWHFTWKGYPNAANYNFEFKTTVDTIWDTVTITDTELYVDISSFPGAFTWEWRVSANYIGPPAQQVYTNGENFV